MKAKTVESKLKEIVEKKFSGVSYVFDDWKAIDRKLSKVSLPAIICVMPISGVFTFNHGRVRINLIAILCSWIKCLKMRMVMRMR